MPIYPGYAPTKYVFIRKAIHERIQPNIKAKRNIPILYCTAKQLIEVKVSFAFGYRIGSAGKYLVPKMHLTLTQNYKLFYDTYIRVIFQEVTVFVMKRACASPQSCKHIYNTVCSFFGGKFTPDFQLH
jgi:hypothetical protein